MKRNIKTIAVAFMAVVATVFSVAAKEKPYKAIESKDAIMHYVGASVLGNTDFTKHIFTDNFEYSNSANQDKYSKKAYIKHLNEMKDIKLDCQLDMEIVDQTNNTAIGKVNMQFDGFTRIDFITLVKTVEGWKISNIVTTYS